ncbi:MAG: hypothetical protein CSA68_07585 [Rhodobacterales bacterium]|nr:MAG: hypothetical protein CSA68_07585 [Rhodobacterales bacterium]
MRALACLAFLATPAVAEDDLLVRYRGAIDACYQQASESQAVLACQSRLAAPCMEQEPDGSSTHGMVACIHAETLFWDEKLNAEYRVTMRMMREQDSADRAARPELAQREERLRAAQRAWLTYRDASCAFDDILWGEGSMRKIAKVSCLSSMTAGRTVDLISIRETFQ